MCYQTGFKYLELNQAGLGEESKGKADAISRSQYDVYSFSTKNNLSEAAVNEVLGILSKVCTFLVLIRCKFITYYYVLLHVIIYLLLCAKPCLMPVQIKFSL